MADIITRLKLESGEYDAKIARAVQGLKAMESEYRNAGDSLAVLEKDQKDYVQSLGQMQTVSNTVRGRISELSSAYTELAVQYRHLTDEEKKGDFGQTLSQSLDQLKVRVQDARQELAEISKELDNTGKNSGGGIFSSLGDKMGGALQVFAGNMMTKAVGAIASLGEQMADVVQEGIKLAQQGEGIRIAFERLGRGDIMDGLRQATHGTVTDLELMKAAVKFNDFKLPLDELGTMLAFAQQKAKDTGQSVDYMVDSIVTGLGRKSLMILDNLGLSASEVKEKMAETGDMTKAVGAIIREQMSKAGEYVETAADRATQADVQLKNAMEDLGRTLSPLQEAGASVFKAWEISALNFIKNALEPLIARFTEAGRLQAAYERQGGDTKVNRMVDVLQNTDEGKRQGLYNTQVNSFNRYIQQRQDYIKLLDNYRTGENNGYTPENKARIYQLYKRFGTDDTSRLQSQIDGATKQLQEYQKAAKEILNSTKPIKPTSPTDTTGTTTPRTTTPKTTTPKVDIPQIEPQTISITVDDAEALKAIQEIQGVTIDPKSLDLTADDNATPAIAKVAGETIDAKNVEVTADDNASPTIDKVEAVKFTPKTIEVRVDSLAAMKALNQIQGVSLTLPVDFSLETTESMKQLTEQLRYYNDLRQNATNTEDYLTATQGIERTKQQMGVQGDALSMGVSTDMMTTMQDMFKQSMIDTFGAAFEGFQTNEKDVEGMKEGDGMEEMKKGMEKLSSVMSGLSTITSGLSAVGIKLDGEFGQFLKGIQGVISIVQGVMAIITASSLPSEAANTISTNANTIALGVLTDAVAANSIIHAIPGLANGGVIGKAALGITIPGNSMSGDNLRLPVVGGGMIAVNSGETILNRAEQGNLVAQMEDADRNQGGSAQPYLDGELIYLGLNNYLRRSGMGEIVTSN